MYPFSTWKIELDCLKGIFECTSDYYNDFRRFNSKILKTSIDEINEMTNVFVSYETIRKARKVAEIEFTCHFKDTNEVINGEFEEITIGRIHEFLQELRKCAQGTMYCHQSVDGKEARGSGRSEDTKNPQRNINVLNVYSNSDCLCIHSKPVETKTNEIPVAQEILRMMELKKTVITFDALHTQRETCNIIASKKGIYVAPVKDNQSGLREEILARFRKYEQTPKKKITTLDTEKRNFRFISLPSNYDDCGFTGMKTFVEMVSHTRKKAITMYFISNTKDTELIAEAIERRWEIENNFHKEKDIYLNEDDIHFTNKTSINNIVILNNLALALAKIYGSISTNEMRVAKKEFKAFPVECISKVQLIMKDTEIIKQIKSNLRRKKR